MIMKKMITQNGKNKMQLESFKKFHEERQMIEHLNKVLQESPQKMPGNAPFEENVVYKC